MAINCFGDAAILFEDADNILASAVNFLKVPLKFEGAVNFGLDNDKTVRILFCY